MQTRPILKTGRLIKDVSRLKGSNEAMTVGLRKRPTFEGIVDYIANGQETIKYPDRLAKFMRNHPYLTQLDGDGIMEMQDQQEEAWKAEEKEHRIKLLKTKRSAPEMRAMRSTRNASTEAQLISDNDWDRMIQEATHVIPAQSASIKNKYNQGKQRHNISQTMDYQLQRLGRASDVQNSMSDDDFEDAMSSASSNVGGPSSSSGGGASMTRAIGSALRAGGTALKFGGRVAWETLKLAHRANRAIGKGVIQPLAQSMADYEESRARRNRSRSRAERSISRPPEAPDSDMTQYFSIATPRRSQSRPRTPAPPPPLPPPPERGRGRSPGTRLIREDQMGPNVRSAARAIIRGGLAFRG